MILFDLSKFIFKLFKNISKELNKNDHNPLYWTSDVWKHVNAVDHICRNNYFDFTSEKSSNFINFRINQRGSGCESQCKISKVCFPHDSPTESASVWPFVPRALDSNTTCWIIQNAWVIRRNDKQTEGRFSWNISRMMIYYTLGNENFKMKSSKKVTKIKIFKTQKNNHF